MQGRIVARCEDCHSVTTAIRTSEGTLTVPGQDGCSGCGGTLTEINGIAEGQIDRSSPIHDFPLAGIVLQTLLHADGNLPQDELIARTGRSPHLVRDTIQQLEESGRVVRVATNEHWEVRLAMPEPPRNARPD